MHALATLTITGTVFVTLAACGATGSTVEPVTAPTAAVAVVDNGASWPEFRGPLGDGLSKETGLNKAWQTKAPKLIWKTSLSDDGYAGPSSAAGLLFLVDHQGGNDIVRAWKLSDGTEVWRNTYADADKSNYGFSRATPAYDAGKLYVVSRLGKVLCLDAKTGKTLWKREMVEEMSGQKPNWDYAGSPIVDGNRLIVVPGAEDGAVVALDKTTGKTLWKGGSGAPGYSTPVIANLDGKRQIVVLLAKKLAGLDAASGKELWSYPWETGYGVNAATPLVIGNGVYITGGYGHGCAMVGVANGQPTVKWQNRTMQAHFSSPVFYKGFIYGTGDPGVLVCMDPATGNTLWKQPGFEKGGMIGGDGVAFVHNGSNGELAMFQLANDAYHEVGRISPLQGQAWTAPIIVDKKLVIRTKDTIAVIDES